MNDSNDWVTNGLSGAFVSVLIKIKIESRVNQIMKKIIFDSSQTYVHVTKIALKELSDIPFT